MEEQVSAGVLRGVYLAARMASNFDVSDSDFSRQFPEEQMETNAVDHQSRACVSYCVDGRVFRPFRLQRNMVVVDRNIGGMLAETPTLQFANEDRQVDVAMSAGHEDCNGIGAVIEELERLVDQLDGDFSLVKKRVANRCQEMDEHIHAKEKHMYKFLCSGGVEVFEELIRQEGIPDMRNAFAEEIARQQMYHALRMEAVYNRVLREQLVLGSWMIRFPEVGVERTDLTMLAFGDGDRIHLRYGSNIVDSFPGVFEDAFTDAHGELDREQIEKRCRTTWVSNHVPFDQGA